MAAFPYHPNQEIFSTDAAGLPSVHYLSMLLPPSHEKEQARHHESGGSFPSFSAFQSPFYSQGEFLAEKMNTNSSIPTTHARSSSLDSGKISCSLSAIEGCETSPQGKRKVDQQCGSSSSKPKSAMNSKQKKSCGDVGKAVEKRAPKEMPSGFIHVRARRGQATDSHSLAERVRREKIRERMKMLQGLVPGCDKVTGKAVLLDEIINYVQSLQNQVELLSMKLASLDPLVYELGLDPDGFLTSPEKLAGISLRLSNTLPTASHGAIAFANAANSRLAQNSSAPFLVHEAPSLFNQGHEHCISTQPDDNGGSLFGGVDFSLTQTSLLQVETPFKRTSRYSRG
ncbi:uncharacterized protein LOC144706124 [Wolffia australiana]